MVLGLGVGAAQAQTAHSIQPATTYQEQTPLFRGPPPVQLSDRLATLSVHPYSSCWSGRHGGVCYDGFPPRPLPSLGGSTGLVRLGFAADSWRFKVSAVDAQGERTAITLVRTAPRQWRLSLAELPDGRYRIDIFGKGPQGDVAAVTALTLS